jgi:hypothetical protein
MNEPPHRLPDVYFEMIERVIDEEGVYPHQGVARKKDDSLEVMAIAVDVPTLIQTFWNKLGESEEVIVGIDMSTRPNQGTHYADALVFAHWTRDPSKKLTDEDCLRVGVINYQHEPRIVDAIDWENTHWTHWVRAVFPNYRPPFLIRTESK